MKYNILQLRKKQLYTWKTTPVMCATGGVAKRKPEQSLGLSGLVQQNVGNSSIAFVQRIAQIGLPST